MRYRLKYLPLALDDLRDITNYITETLKAPKAAMDLLDTLDESISRLEQFPYSCKVFHPIKSTDNEYRLLPVKNYAVFYVVNGEVVEIHRVLYAKMDITKVIK
ncbi:plasmid stabilization protein [Virgibacillus profundi]|uniref:Plasmid stabilization protein n=1 Tax=Virgibacillus profundi TaxID=2024555 RepID=A0A2A2I8U9_9BACI|nr:type II toxin-antitoxin system RelE/ParE family toxin [Virgibacillus profundi]PAV27808.1 plasmid stabilization protein [Virgibacillus profundi]PXY51935.1 type II toxin-antitoxin system RelE/ParE family toxin [Virgibacillus profundi]